MKEDFREAFLWHLENGEASLAQIARETGVSRDVLKKLSTRPGASTTVENAVLIAAFFGKTINQFIRRESIDPRQSAQNLFELLGPEDSQAVVAQIRGLLAMRARAAE